MAIAYIDRISGTRNLDEKMSLIAAGVFVLKKRYFPLVVASCASLLLHGLLVAALLDSYSPGKNNRAPPPARLQVVV